jgi:eukaryotic-like serine/threonine-protein kinase
MGGLDRSAGGIVAARTSTPANEPRYEVFGEIASGGMASVRYGRRIGPLGISRPVAVKRLHPQFANNPDFVSMFIDEARLSARLVHVNIVATLDVLLAPGEISLVMEYVHGESLGALLEKQREFRDTVPLRIAVSLIASVLHGLHAAHEATDDAHRPLHVVHRDVSPQNILVGADGVPRMIDFGIARALGRMRSTPSGEIKGKLAYIAPEQLQGGGADRRADIYGASVVLWETLTGQALFDAESESALVHRVLHAAIPAPSSVNPGVPRVLDEIVLRGLARDPKQRYATALEMALALERAIPPATQSEVARWLDRLIGDKLRNRARALTLMQEAPAQQEAPAPVRSRANAPETRKIELASSQPGWPQVPEPDDALAADTSLAIEEPSLHGRPSSEIRLRGRRSAVRGLVIGLLLAAAAAAVLAWAQLRVRDEPREVPLVRPAPELPVRVDEALQPSAATANQAPPVEAPSEVAAPEAEKPAALGAKPEVAMPEAANSELETPEVAKPEVATPEVGKPEKAAAEPQAETPAKAKTVAKKWKPRPRPERRASQPQPQAQQPKPKPNCDPYYYIDHEGIRRPKPECL